MDIRLGLVVIRAGGDDGRSHGVDGRVFKPVDPYSAGLAATQCSGEVVAAPGTHPHKGLMVRDEIGNVLSHLLPVHQEADPILSPVDFVHVVDGGIEQIHLLGPHAVHSTRDIGRLLPGGQYQFPVGTAEQPRQDLEVDFGVLPGLHVCPGRIHECRGHVSGIPFGAHAPSIVTVTIRRATVQLGTGAVGRAAFNLQAQCRNCDAAGGILKNIHVLRIR